MTAPLSGNDRILAALRTGPKLAAELYGLNAMVHSRVAELRRRGFVIDCERLPGNGPTAYRYSLREDVAA